MPDLSVLHELADAGYFDRVAAGDHRACGLFVRMAAYYLNPTGDPNGWGALRKTGPGQNVEGYSEDAIVFGSDPASRNNVCDIIGGAGAPGATLNTRPSFVSRRASDVWEKPVPLTTEQAQYLLGGAVPNPTPTPTPPPVPVPPPTPTPCGYQPGDAALLVEVSMAVDRIEAALARLERLEQHGNIAHVRLLLENLGARLEQGLVVDASARLIGPIRGTVKG